MPTNIDCSQPFELTYNANSWTRLKHTVKVSLDDIADEFSNELLAELGDDYTRRQLEGWAKENGGYIINHYTGDHGANHDGGLFTESSSDWERDSTDVKQNEIEEIH
jgi:hypothetical protein